LGLLYIAFTLMKTAVLAFIMMIAAFTSKAGYEVRFCDSIDVKGHCRGKADAFKLYGERLKLQVMVFNAEQLATTKLSYRIFFMKNEREGELTAELSVYTRPEWQSASKQVYFFKPGRYKVDVFNEKDEMIASDFVTISDR
jgi:hypothetical protein